MALATIAFAAVSAHHELARVAEVGAARRVDTCGSASRRLRRFTVTRLKDETRDGTAVGVVRNQHPVASFASAGARRGGTSLLWVVTYHGHAVCVYQQKHKPNTLKHSLYLLLFIGSCLWTEVALYSQNSRVCDVARQQRRSIAGAPDAYGRRIRRVRLHRSADAHRGRGRRGAEPAA
jgi:hypothetical protein